MLLSTCSYLLRSPTTSPFRARPRLSIADPSEWIVRAASWPEDFDAVCAVRKPTEFVVESGSAGFMGKRVVIDSPEEAQRRRVQARLGSVLRDNATVLLVVDRARPASVVGTLDCVLQEHSDGGSVPRLCVPSLY